MSEHPNYKLGRNAPKRAPSLRLSSVLTGVVPEHPVAVDHLGTAEFGLYANDTYGDCGPTSVANLARLVSLGLTGTMVAPSQDDVFDLYRRSGNPGFDPDTGADDNGVVMQTMLEALLHGGIGGITPVAFAEVDVTNDDELTAAVSIFGGALWGVDLRVAQQAQTDAEPPVWDYVRSGDWGGHAIVCGAYEANDRQDVVSWAERIACTDAFRREQLEEAWVVVWPWNLDNPAFQQGVDLDALRAAYHDLTGRDLPTVPEPEPEPEPGGDVPPEPPGCFRVGPLDDRRVARIAAAAAARGLTPDEYMTWKANRMRFT